jgi:hypothetical protein
LVQWDPGRSARKSMKIAIVSESPADEAAIKFLVDAIVGKVTELIVAPRLRPNGWPHVLSLLPSIVKYLHYRSDVDGLIAIVDSDDSPVHNASHQAPQVELRDCRLCLLRTTIELSVGRLSPVSGRVALKTAFGVAVPSIEAWYRCGIDPRVNENAWSRHLRGHNVNYNRRSLKVDAYGSHQPGLILETKAAVEAAKRLATNLEELERLFPNGFGSLLRDLRGWEKV